MLERTGQVIKIKNKMIKKSHFNMYTGLKFNLFQIILLIWTPFFIQGWNVSTQLHILHLYCNCTYSYSYCNTSHILKGFQHHLIHNVGTWYLWYTALPHSCLFLHTTNLWSVYRKLTIIPKCMFLTTSTSVNQILQHDTH